MKGAACAPRYSVRRRRNNFARKGRAGRLQVSVAAWVKLAYGHCHLGPRQVRDRGTHLVRVLLRKSRSQVTYTYTHLIFTLEVTLRHATDTLRPRSGAAMLISHTGPYEALCPILISGRAPFMRLPQAPAQRAADRQRCPRRCPAT